VQGTAEEGAQGKEAGNRSPLGGWGAGHSLWAEDAAARHPVKASLAARGPQAGAPRGLDWAPPRGLEELSEKREWQALVRPDDFINSVWPTSIV